jgi:hypothetical protein
MEIGVLFETAGESGKLRALAEATLMVDICRYRSTLEETAFCDRQWRMASRRTLSARWLDRRQHVETCRERHRLPQLAGDHIYHI